MLTSIVIRLQLDLLSSYVSIVICFLFPAWLLGFPDFKIRQVKIYSHGDIWKFSTYMKKCEK